MTIPGKQPPVIFNVVVRATATRVASDAQRLVEESQTRREHWRGSSAEGLKQVVEREYGAQAEEEKEEEEEEEAEEEEEEEEEGCQ